MTWKKLREKLIRYKLIELANQNKLKTSKNKLLTRERNKNVVKLTVFVIYEVISSKSGSAKQSMVLLK